MTHAINIFRLLRTDERGITAVEYAVLAAMVGVAIISMRADFAAELSNAFTGLFTPSPLP